MRQAMHPHFVWRKPMRQVPDTSERIAVIKDELCDLQYHICTNSVHRPEYPSCRGCRRIERLELELQMCEIIQQKQAVLSAVLDGGKMEGDIDVFDLLLKRLQKRDIKFL